MDRHPGGHLIEEPFAGRGQGAIGTLGQVEQQVAIPAHHVRQAVDDVRGGPIPLTRPVEPSAEGSVRLPGQGTDDVQPAAFDVLDAPFREELAAADVLVGVDRLQSTAPLLVAVVVPGHQVEADVAERDAAIRVEEIRIVAVQQVAHAFGPALVGRGILGVPLGRHVLREARQRRMVEVLPRWVRTIIGDARQGTRRIAAMTRLIPGITGSEVLGHAEAQALGLGGFSPSADDIPPRSDVDGVPRVVARIPQIEVVVVDRHAHEVAGSGGGVALGQVLGVEALGPPLLHHVAPSVLRGVPPSRHMVTVGPMPLHVHVAGVPFARTREDVVDPLLRQQRGQRIPIVIAGNGLRAPMAPDAEFGISEPVRATVGGQGGTRATERREHGAGTGRVHGETR